MQVFAEAYKFFLMLLPLLKPKKLHLSQFDISNIFQLRYCCNQVKQLREYLEVVVLSGVSAQQSLQIVLFARKLNSRQITDKLSEQYNIAGQNNSQTYFLKHTIEPPPLDLPTILFFWLWEQGNLGILAPGRYFSWLYECCVICAIEQEKDEMV